MFNKKDVVNWVLLVLVGFGLISCLLYSINLDLNSDMVTPGLVTKAIVDHHDFGFTFPVGDPYFFTDIFTFYFVPQVLSGYNPGVLRLTAFVMFLGVVALFSYLVYRHSNATSALIFAALATNLPPEVCGYFLSPEFHVGTLLFTGIFLLLFQKDLLKSASTPVVVALLVVVALIVVSDSIIIAFFVVPYLIYGLYSERVKKAPALAEGNKKEQARKALASRKSATKVLAVLVALVFSTLIAYELKANNFFTGGHTFIITAFKAVDLGKAVGTNIPLYVNALAMLVNGNLRNVLSLSLNGFDVFLALVFVGVLAYSLVAINKKAEYLYLMFGLGAAVMLVAFVFTSFADGLWSARFLIYTAISVFAVVALAYKPEVGLGRNLNTVFLAAIILLILAAASGNVGKIAGYDYQPNKEDYALIENLEKNGLTFGFSDYNSANKLIYLSQERVMYPQVETVDNGFKVHMMLTTPLYYDLSQGNGYFCLLLNKNDTYYQSELKYAQSHTPLNTYQFGNYSVYQYSVRDLTG